MQAAPQLTPLDSSAAVLQGRLSGRRPVIDHHPRRAGASFNGWRLGHALGAQRNKLTMCERDRTSSANNSDET